MIWDRPLGRYPGHVTRPAKRQPAITNISAEEVISDETTNIPCEFSLIACEKLLKIYYNIIYILRWFFFFSF